MSYWKTELEKINPNIVVEDNSEKGYKEAYFKEVIASKKHVTSKCFNGEIVNTLDYIAHKRMEAEMSHVQNHLSNHDKVYLWDLISKISEFDAKNNKK